MGLLTLALAIAAALGLLASACGGSSTEGVAQVDSTETTTSGSEPTNGSSSGDPAAFSACMRANGVPNFPDPDPDGRVRFGPGIGIDPESSQFNAARRACRKLEPEENPPSPAERARDRAQILEYAACMRANGLPTFPDPKPSGELMLDKDGEIDPTSPQFKAADKACEDLAPGNPGSDPVPQP